MSEAPLRIALVGCGLVGPAHARAIQALDSTTLVTVCSRTEARLKPFAEEYDVPWTTDYDDLLTRDDIDAIDITAPPFAHEELVTKAAAAGKHVILEKPIATDVETGQRIIDACAKANVKLAIIFQNRWRKSYVLLKQAVDRGDLGSLLLGDVSVKWFRPQSYYDADAWRGTFDGEGGGCLINQGIHYIDGLQYIMGPIDWLYGHATTTPHHTIEVEDIAVAALRWKSGALGTITASTALLPGIPDRISVHGTKGSVVISGGSIYTWQVEGMDEDDMKAKAEEPTGSGASDPMAFPIAWHMQQIDDMVQAIRQNRQPAVNGPEGLKALKIVQAVYQSTKTNQPIHF